MKTKITFIVFVLIMVFDFSAWAQIKINHAHFTELFNNRLYEQLFNEAAQIRISEEYGKNWMIDFYVSIALCGLGNTKIAEDAFSYIEHEYALHPKQKELIQDGRRFCHPGISPITPSSKRLEIAYLVLNNSNATAYPVSLVRGKLGQVLDCRSDLEEYQFNPLFDQAEFQKRLFEIEEKDTALIYYREFLPANLYNVNSFGRYIIVTKAPENLNSNEVEKAAQELERVYQFMVNRYNVRPPNYLITVYLMGNQKNLAEVAEITHGLKIPSKSLGYSSIADLSVLGNSSKTGLGTIKHELFHLIIRTDIGDIPGWLDEGVAGMYEESHWEGNFLKYDNNLWRTKILQQNSRAEKPLPLLRSLINNNWNEFTPDDATTICELSVNYALAKHFAMFLEEKDQLLTVINAFRNRRNIFTNTTSVNINSIQILEEALNRRLPEIQQQFDDWLSDKFGISVHRDKETVLNRIEKLEVIEFACYNRPEVKPFKQEYLKLSDELRHSGTIVPEELLEKCIKLLAKAEKMYFECEGHR